MSILKSDDITNLERKQYNKLKHAEKVKSMHEDILCEETRLFEKYRKLIRQGLDEMIAYAKDHKPPFDIKIIHRRRAYGRGYDYYTSGYWLGYYGLSNSNSHNAGFYGYTGQLFLSQKGDFFFVCASSSSFNSKDKFYIPNCKIIKSKNQCGYSFSGGKEKLEYSDIDGIANLIAYSACKKTEQKYGKVSDIDDGNKLYQYKNNLITCYDSAEENVRKYLIKVLSGDESAFSFL